MSKKLLLGFGIVLLLTAILGGVSIWSMKDIDNTYNSIVVGDMPGLYYLGQAQTALRGGRSEMRAMNITMSRGDMQSYASSLALLQQYQAQTRDNMVLFRGIIRADNMDAINRYDNFVQTFETYVKTVDEYIRISDTGDVDVAYAYLTNTVGPAANRAISDLDIMLGNRLTIAEDNSDSASASVNAIIYLIMGVLLAVIIISLLLVYYISSIITAPLGELLKVAKQVGDYGDLNFSEEEIANFQKYAAYKDELGQSMNAFSAMMDNIILRSKLLEQVSAGDLTVDVQRISDRDTLGTAILVMVDNLNETLGSINQAAEQVSSGSEQVSSGAQALASGSTEQAASVEEFSASINEVQAQTEQNNQIATDTFAQTQKASELMTASMDYMNQMTEAMHEINESSHSIAKVIKVIEDIAFQTNILALNATVEAARAGSAGKGFAVVADEVRNLASKSAEAAKETAALIESSVQSVSLGNEIAAKTGESLIEVVEISQANAGSMQQLSEASRQQTLAIAEITTGIDQISAVIQANSATAEESAAASEELSGQANMLKNMVAKFRIKGYTTGYSVMSPRVAMAPPAIDTKINSSDKYDF